MNDPRDKNAPTDASPASILMHGVALSRDEFVALQSMLDELMLHARVQGAGEEQTNLGTVAVGIIAGLIIVCGLITSTVERVPAAAEPKRSMKDFIEDLILPPESILNLMAPSLIQIDFSSHRGHLRDENGDEAGFGELPPGVFSLALEEAMAKSVAKFGPSNPNSIVRIGDACALSPPTAARSN